MKVFVGNSEMSLSGKKICIVVENLPVPFDRRVWQESLALKEAGAKVTVICPKTKNFPLEYEEIEGVKVYRHPLPEANSSIEYIKEYLCALYHEARLLFKVFRKQGVQDVIHACNPPDLIFIAAAPFFLFTRCKFLFDHHDINPELWIAKFGKKGLGYRAMILVERLTYHFAKHAIVTNESYKEIAMRRGHKREEDVTIVRSGPNIAKLKVGPAKPEVKKGFKYLVGYIGVMGKQEGIDLLLGAIDYLVYKKNRKDIRFCIMGGGPALEELRQLNVSMKLTDYVEFPGRVSDEYLADVLNTADVCVNPDLPSEMNDKSTMNKIMEYMAFGKPIVQFTLKEGRFSAQEASLYAENTSIEDFGDKILWLLDNPEVAAKMGQFGRHRVETELSWDYEKPKLIGAYKKLLGL